jgi:hypothetical protein
MDPCCILFDLAKLMFICLGVDAVKHFSLETAVKVTAQVMPELVTTHYHS